MSSIILASNVIGHIYSGIHTCRGRHFYLIPNTETNKDETNKKERYDTN